MENKFTEVDALEKCIKVWQWLSEHVGSTKAEAYYELALHMDDYRCALCEYTLVDGSSCYSCPLYGKWTEKTNEYSVCMNNNSYYKKWRKYTKKHSRSLFFKKYYARKVALNAGKIVYLCKEEIKEVKNGK